MSEDLRGTSHLAGRGAASVRSEERVMCDMFEATEHGRRTRLGHSVKVKSGELILAHRPRRSRHPPPVTTVTNSPRRRKGSEGGWTLEGPSDVDNPEGEVEGSDSQGCMNE